MAEDHTLESHVLHSCDCLPDFMLALSRGEVVVDDLPHDET